MSEIFDFNQWREVFIILLKAEKGKIQARKNEVVDVEHVATLLRVFFEEQDHKETYRDLKAFRKEFHLLANKYPKIHNELHKALKALGDSISESLSALNSLGTNDENSRLKRGKMPIPSHIAKHLLAPLEAYLTQKEELEKYRFFLTSELQQLVDFNLDELDFSMPMLPLEKQEDTDWSRKLRSTLKRSLDNTQK